MCGIAGIASLDRIDRAAIAPRLARALDRLAPRGPDGQGTWIDGDCALGHTRLAVIDLSAAGGQPMARHGLVIVYNGEIYNFASLRAELEALGHIFESSTDTEILLAGWRQWGEALLPRLRGMFAFALWDPGARELVLVRDRFGKKPLLYAADGAGLAFASDLVALDRLRASSTGIDPVALRLLFTLRFVPEPWSIRPGVAKLPAGHLLRFADGEAALGRWYDPATDRPQVPADSDGVLAGLRDRFDAAVADRLVADVPVGVYLSGGIDSALVAASMIRRQTAVRSFTVGFEGAAPYYEERPAARTVARHLGTDHTEIVIGADAALGAMDAVFDGLDEPFADSSAVPSYLLARETRRHVTVALAGDGADEVFAGYRKHRAETYAAAYQALPGWLRRGLIEPASASLPESKTDPVREGLRRLRRFVAHAGKSPAARQAGLYRLLGEADLDRLLIAPAPAPDLEGMIAGLRRAAGTEDPINAMLTADMALGLPGDMLVKVDRMSMANGLEVRCPFLDHRLVAYAAALPGGLKLGRAGGKLILRRAFADRLPRAVFRRPKKGFELPIAPWLTGPLADRVRRAIDPGRLARQGIFRPDLPRAWSRDLIAGRRDTSEPLWTLIAFQAWADRHGGGA
ncbi:MAG: asparagine synthase (glutamine-hydrolyzing) [Alphaproteobacteria bacterium]|jgi:asparagine synthase (glutamine-hydrolysing)|nr:asparagine synthase (glutamine-hydrolyzing) [Alphaproteobacteria bacterium]MDP6518089.1 asparagine synthase (glutamine-hydrolyzing) [Alphaproteobacteria bacterium]